MASDRVTAALVERIARAEAGDRLPTVRALMRELNVGQGAVQAALATLSAKGLLSTHVGRGTFVVRGGRSTAGAANPAVLILSGRAASDRNHRVADTVALALADKAVTCLQVVYDRLDHAVEVLQGAIPYDLCLLQSHLEIVPVRLLDFLQRGERAVVIDGSRLSGIDVDIVSSNWTASLDLAFGALRRAGHRDIGFVTWPSPARSIEATRRQFESIRGWLDLDRTRSPMIVLERVPAIGEPSGSLLRDAIRAHRTRRGGWPFTALVAWTGGDANALVEALDDLKIRVPDDLSIAVIGHADIEAEHLRRFTIAGHRASQAASAVTDTILTRLANRTGAFETRYLDDVLLDFGSIASLS